jgi:hypothetical protein
MAEDDVMTQFWAIYTKLDDVQEQQVIAELLESHSADSCIIDEAICDLHGWGIPLRCLKQLPVRALLFDFMRFVVVSRRLIAFC